MKKWFIKSFAVLSLVFYLVGCGSMDNIPPNPEQDNRPNDNTNLNREDSNINQDDSDRFNENNGQKQTNDMEQNDPLDENVKDNFEENINR